jgi:hypothetical protein
MHTGKIWPRDATELIDQFAFHVSQEIMEEKPDPTTVAQAQKREDWPRWEAAINSELDSLIKRQAFGPITQTPPDINLTGYKFMFVKKWNALGEVIRYKA